MALSAENAAWLAECIAARRKLLLGESVVSISSGGRSWSKAQISLEALNAEIALLEAADRTVTGEIKRGGAIRFNW